MMLPLYRAATTLLAPAITHYLKRRMARGKEDPKRFDERLGIAGRERPNGPLIWMHGASVGESVSMLPLIARLRASHPSATVLVTTGTLTSAALMADRLPAGAFHQYVPVDRIPYVRRFLDHWNPDLALWFESEFWPNLLCETSERGIPLVLINGRVSADSYQGWQKAKGLIANLLGRFALCFGQSEEDTERLKALGAIKTACVGNLKFAAEPLPAASEELLKLEQAIAGRPCWVAASTHGDEETLMGEVHSDVAKKHPGLLTILAPRHPERGDTIASILREQGRFVSQRSKGEPLNADTEIYLTDTMGELGLWFTLSSIVYMGKSLIHQGGQNPLEPAKLNCAVLHGPGMENFKYIAKKLKKADASLVVQDQAALSKALGKLLDEPQTIVRLANAAGEVADAEAGVLDRLMKELKPVLTDVLPGDMS